MSRFRILHQTSHFRVQFRKRHVIHVHWTGNGPEWRRYIAYLITTETARYLLWSIEKVIFKTHLSYLLSLVSVSLSLVLVQVLFSCFDLLFSLVLDFMLSSREFTCCHIRNFIRLALHCEGDMGYYGIAVLGFFFMRYFGNIKLWYHLALRYAVFHHFWLTVFGEIRLFTVLRYRLFALSFRYNTQKKTQ